MSKPSEELILPSPIEPEFLELDLSESYIPDNLGLRNKAFYFLAICAAIISL